MIFKGKKRKLEIVFILVLFPFEWYLDFDLNMDVWIHSTYDEGVTLETDILRALQRPYEYSLSVPSETLQYSGTLKLQKELIFWNFNAIKNKRSARKHCCPLALQTIPGWAQLSEQAAARLSQAPEHTHREASISGKLGSHCRTLNSKSSGVLELARPCKILERVWKCGINTLGKQCNKTKYDYVAALSRVTKK